MKQLLLALAGTVIGIALMAALGYFLLVAPTPSAAKSAATNEPDPCSASPSGLVVAQHHQVPDVDQVAIFGIVANNSSTGWRDIVVLAEIGGATKLNECEVNLHGPVPPSAKRPFLIQCSKTSLQGPSNAVEYRVKVSEACRHLG